jgi:hypothetical protein
VGSPEYDDWVLNEAIEESFPASDPSMPVQPSSNIGQRYVSYVRNANRSRQVAAMVLLGVLSAVCAIALLRRRG